MGALATRADGWVACQACPTAQCRGAAAVLDRSPVASIVHHPGLPLQILDQQGTSTGRCWRYVVARWQRPEYRSDSRPAHQYRLVDPRDQQSVDRLPARTAQGKRIGPRGRAVAVKRAVHEGECPEGTPSGPSPRGTRGWRYRPESAE